MSVCGGARVLWVVAAEVCRKSRAPDTSCAWTGVQVGRAAVTAAFTPAIIGQAVAAHDGAVQVVPQHHGEAALQHLR